MQKVHQEKSPFFIQLSHLLTVGGSFFFEVVKLIFIIAQNIYHTYPKVPTLFFH